MYERQGRLKEAQQTLQALYSNHPSERVGRRLILLDEKTGRTRDAAALRNTWDPPKRHLRALQKSRR